MSPKKIFVKGKYLKHRYFGYFENTNQFDYAYCHREISMQTRKMYNLPVLTKRIENIKPLCKNQENKDNVTAPLVQVQF